MAARASRLENQDAIDFAIVSMLPDPKEVQNSRPLISLKKFNCSSDSYLSTSLELTDVHRATICLYHFNCIILLIDYVSCTLKFSPL